MLVLIDGKEYVDLDECKPIGSGQDGDLYLHGNSVIKICHSGYMTYEKLNDFRKAVKKCEDKGVDISKKHIILPSKKVENPKEKVKKLTITPLFGYTQNYKLERHYGISSLKTDDFIRSVEIIHDEMHELFSKNYIGITDTNPKNLLVSESGEIFFIDHDRNVSPSSMASEKSVVYDDDYFRHNEKRFSKMIKRALIIEAFRGLEASDSNIRKALDIMSEEEIKNTSVWEMYSDLSKYNLVSDYAKDKALELKLKKN